MKNYHYLSIFLLSLFMSFCQCRKQLEQQTEYNKEGVKTRIPYLWRTQTGYTASYGAGLETTAVYDGKILLEGESEDGMALLHLLDINTGKILWSKDFFNISYYSIFNCESYVYKNHLIFEKGRLYNLDFPSGEFSWIQSLITPESSVHGIDSLLFFIAQGKDVYNKDSINGVFYTTVNEGTMHSLYVPYLGNVGDPNDYIYNPGGVEWVQPYRNNNGEIMLVFYIWSGKAGPAGNAWIELYNFDQKKFIYQNDTIQGSLTAYPPIVYENKLYHSIGDTTGLRTQCLDLNTGKVIWSHDNNGLSTGRSGSIIVDGMYIAVVGDLDKHIMALDAETGAVIWRHATTAGQLSSPMSYLNGIVYFASSTDAKVHAIEATTGKDLWALDDAPDYRTDYDDFLHGGYCAVIPGKDGEKGKIIVSSMKHAYCFEAER